MTHLLNLLLIFLYSTLFDSEHLKLNYLELVEAAEKMIGLLDVTDQQCKHLEELTRDQAFSKIWMRYHCERITASRLYEVVRTDPHKPAMSLIKSICYPESERSRFSIMLQQNMVRSMKSKLLLPTSLQQ